MTDLMLKTAQALSEEQADGHGDRWDVLTGGADVLIDNLRTIIQKSEMFDTGIVDETALQAIVADGEPSCIPVLLYTGQEEGTSRTGVMSLHVVDRAAKEIAFSSAYPFFEDGIEIEGTIDRLLLYPNRIEATLEIGLENGVLIQAFDPIFCHSRALYRSGQRYRFSLSALAYSMKPMGHVEKVIDGPNAIRRFHAMEEWAKTHGECTKADEVAALAAWHPQTPKDMEPIRIAIDGGTMLVPNSNGFSDDALYLGEVVCVTANAARVLDTSFWRIDVVVIRSDQVRDLILPIYVSEKLFNGEWRPSVGEQVTGNAWMQAYAKAVL